MTTLIDTSPFCGQCGWDTRMNVGGDIRCDACGADLTLYGFTLPAATTTHGHAHSLIPGAGATHPAPPPPSAADESPCASRPPASATKKTVHAYLTGAWGYTDDELAGLTKHDLVALVTENCG